MLDVAVSPVDERNIWCPDLEVARELTEPAKGHSLRWIAEEVGVGRGTVERYVKKRTTAR
jgi:hypothetical protein